MLLVASATLTPFSVNNFYLKALRLRAQGVY